jgi:hypothetical protein
LPRRWKSGARRRDFRNVQQASRGTQRVSSTSATCAARAGPDRPPRSCSRRPSLVRDSGRLKREVDKFLDTVRRLTTVRTLSPQACRGSEAACARGVAWQPDSGKSAQSIGGFNANPCFVLTLGAASGC